MELFWSEFCSERVAELLEITNKIFSEIMSTNQNKKSISKN